MLTELIRTVNHKNLTLDQQRINPGENIKLLLFSEVDSVCPRCCSLLMYDKKKAKRKRFEVAHIYPINPTVKEEELLQNEEKLNDNLNHIDNLICLCVDCHTKFDKPRTIEDYQKLVATKKVLIQRHKEKTLWDKSSLESDISLVIQALISQDFNYDNEDILNYDPKTIDDKLNDSITAITKRTIRRSVQDYYFIIREQFIKLDAENPMTSELISNQIKGHYLQLLKINPSATQKDIFNALSTWIKIKTNQESSEACNVIVSYFIQNCEIFE